MDKNSFLIEQSESASYAPGALRESGTVRCAEIVKTKAPKASHPNAISF
jgi:hypothetical protein